MKCKYCDGTGTTNWCVNGTFINCPHCGGTGEVEQTNEEWFCGIYTEAKAEWLADHMKCSKCPQQNRCNGYHGGCVALMLEWLKQPHQKE